MKPHRYTSTACLHEEHGYCSYPKVSRAGRWEILGPSYCSELDGPKRPAQCKFCASPCLCPCHRNLEGNGTRHTLKAVSVVLWAWLTLLVASAIGGSVYGLIMAPFIAFLVWHWIEGQL